MRGQASQNGPDQDATALSKGAVAFLLVTVFFSGAAVMVIEMTAVRVLQPFFGSTNYVWTNVIAIVLASLSLGYAVGGRLADRHPSPLLLYALLASGGLLVLGGSPLATPVSEWLLPVEMHVEGVAQTLIRASFAATVILFAPPTLLLGMVSPMAVRLLSTGGVGSAAGRVFALGTVGSILGTYLPTYVLVPHIGSRATLMVAAGMLLVPAVIGLGVFGRRRGIASGALLLMLALPTAALAHAEPRRSVPELPSGGTADVLAEGESPYQYVTVREDRDPDGTTVRLLTLNEGVFTYHSYHVVGQVLTNSRYYDDYALLPLLLDLEPGSPLRGAVVGLAGGVTARQWQHFWSGLYDLHVDGAEIDPLVVEWGRRWFHLPAEDEPWLDIHVMDGRQMVAAAPQGSAAGDGYHMLVIDAFTQELYIPFHVGTREFFELCRSRLAPGGVLAMNVYAYSSDSPNLLALENTLATAFGSCVRVRQYIQGNFVLIARNGDSPPDVTRFAPLRVAERFGERADVTEWEKLVRLGGGVPAKSVIVRPSADEIVLTDDHAPLERLMDEVIDRKEAEVRGR